MQEPRSIGLFLCGDVMSGRGIDQVLPHPSHPVPYEPCIRDARQYVQLAEQLHGPIPRPMSEASIWGEALHELQVGEVDARIINLETAITRSDEPWPGKEIHYRMHPRNIGCLTAAGVDCCCLANNHVLDWGYAGLAQTLQALDEAGVAHAGAGRNAAEAAAPAAIRVAGNGRVLVLAIGSISSGIPWEWAAGQDRPGVNLLEDLSEASARRMIGQIRQARQSGDRVVVSIHWGSNWGYEVPDEQIAFAHRLVDEGVDLVHGHSSHHVRPVEVYRHRLILYGCGDFLNDYEGIEGAELFRSDLRLMYVVRMEPDSGHLVELRLIPMQARRFRLSRALAKDVKWLCDLLNGLRDTCGAQFMQTGGGQISIRAH